MDLIVIIPAGPSEEEESGQAKVGDKVPPWPTAKTKKMTRMLALWVAKKGRPFSISAVPLDSAVPACFRPVMPCLVLVPCRPAVPLVSASSD